jgi:hypothetical protein
MKTTRQKKCNHCPLAQLLEAVIGATKSVQERAYENHFKTEVTKPGTLQKIAGIKNYQLN